MDGVTLLRRFKHGFSYGYEMLPDGGCRWVFWQDMPKEEFERLAKLTPGADPRYAGIEVRIPQGGPAS